MKQHILTFALIISLFNSCSSKDTLRDKYPGKLLTDDYNILTEKVMIDEGDVLPIGTLGTDSNPAPRWLCADSINLRFNCKKSDEKSPELNDYSADLDMTINIYGKKYDFYFRSQISYERCVDHQTAWKKLLHGEEYFCISGTMMNSEGKNKNSISAAYHRFKTKSGCDSWAEGDCR